MVKTLSFFLWYDSVLFLHLYENDSNVTSADYKTEVAEEDTVSGPSGIAP